MVILIQITMYIYLDLNFIWNVYFLIFSYIVPQFHICPTCTKCFLYECACVCVCKGSAGKENWLKALSYKLLQTH